MTDGFVGVDCPKCSPGAGKYKLGINLAWGGASCWTCGKQSTARALADLSGRPLGAVLKLLEGVVRERAVERVRTGLVLPPGLGPLLEAHREYLRDERGIDPDVAERLWGVKGLGIAGRLSWRVWVPVHDGDKVASWTTRSIGKTGRRYINAKPTEEAVAAKSLLLGERLCRHAAIVVEGPFDALRIGPGAVSIMGVGFTKEQVARIARFPTRAVVFDSEPAAQRRARELCEALAVLPGRTTRVEIDAPDPGSADAREVRRLRKCLLDD